MNGPPILSAIIFAPFAGALLLALVPRARPAAVRAVALAASLSTLALALACAGSFDRGAAGYQLVERHAWISSLNVHYYLGLDGLSLVLILLTGIVAPAGLAVSWSQARDPRLFSLLFLAAQGSALGVFLALDFFHWFLFWELSLVPTFFLIKLWGGAGASRAAYQFVIYTLAGSAFLLLGFAAIFAATGSLDFAALGRLGASGELSARLASLGGFWPEAVFLGVLAGFAVKVPLYPFHTWLPAAYAEAPTGVSMFLTGVMSKMGVYGFLRILWPLFPAALHAAAGPLLWLALGGVVFGAFAATRQDDLFAVVSPAGPSAPAATAALSGAILQMFNHGLSASALFLCIGVLESRAGGRRGLGDFGGVRSAAPIFAGLCGIAMFSSLGLPGLNGFVGEFLIFRGVFGLAPWAAAVGCLGLLGTALFLLTFWQRVFHGPRAGAAAGEFRDLAGPNFVVLGALVALMFLFGLLPGLLTGIYNPLVTAWVGGLPTP